MKSHKCQGPCFGNSTYRKRHSRREFLHVGLIGGLGLSLGSFLKSTAYAEAKKGVKLEPKALSVINIFLPGGMAAQETWDPKPYAPIEYRGPINSIPTKLAGVRFGEYMKHTAKIADKITVVRSMTHGEAAHERGTHNMFTGYRPSPAIQYPSIGSIISHEFGSRKNLPPYICIPNQPNTFAGPGYLSTQYGPFGLGADPAKDNFKVRDLSLPDGIEEDQFNRRKRLLDIVDDHFREQEKSDGLDSMDTFYQNAYSLISSEHARSAFDLSKETEKTKEQYGKTEAGMRMLLTRRLIEAGVRFVSMTTGGWDHHQNILNGIKKNVPPFDQAFAALINDLEQRGLLDTTLVLVTSEFGRTPKINKDAGRDHWPRVFSIAMAGGGISKGLIYGKSDATSSAPDEDPLTIENLATTIYHQLGIDAHKELIAPGGRPIEIVKGGEVVQELIS